MHVFVGPAGDTVAFFLVVKPLAIIGGLVFVDVLTLASFGIVLPKSRVDFTVGEFQLPDSMTFSSNNFTSILRPITKCHIAVTSNFSCILESVFH